MGEFSTNMEATTPDLAGGGGMGGAASEIESPGVLIGPYRLLSIIGEGGFGAVWLAERRDPMVQRVALKIIKPGMGSREVIARFEQERQALAVMDHPNVARVLDAGTTPASLGARPYFVMEYVRGETITAFCDRHRLTIRERLELFVSVCQAVQHAHHKGIIHRDLKPGNVLVAEVERCEAQDDRHDDGPPSTGTSAGVVRGALVKVIDFGIAKAVSQVLTDKTIYTEQGRMIGTPEYMSPEQAESGAGGQDVDTRSDVYSLGVMLYELLTGVLPFEPRQLRGRGYAEIQRIIREVEPPIPSRRLTSMGYEPLESIARLRGVERGSVARALRNELEWIPLKAMAKERARRYSSPDALAGDIRRFLAGMPLEAGPESRAYRLRKFVRRHRFVVFAAASVALALLMGLGGTVWQAMRASDRAAAARVAESLARQERDAAQAARRRAEAVTAFVIKALESSAPEAGGREDTTIAEAMRAAMREIDAGTFRGDPETEALLQTTIGGILLNNGKPGEAEPILRAALGTREALANKGGDQGLVAVSLGNLGQALQELGRLPEAEELLDRMMQITRCMFTGDRVEIAQVMGRVATVRAYRGRYVEAEPLFQSAVEMFDRLGATESEEFASALNNLASIRQGLGRVEEAVPLFERSLALLRRLHAGDHPRIADALVKLARARRDLRSWEQAEALNLAALEMYRRMYKGDHPDTAYALNALARVRQTRGNLAGAEPLYVEVLEMSRRSFPGDHPSVAQALNNLAGIHFAQGKPDEAEPLFQQALDMRRRLFQGDHPDVLQSLSNVAIIKRERGDLTGAERLLAEALEMSRRLYPGDHQETATSLVNLASVHAALGRAADAEAEADEGVAMLRRRFSGDHPDTAWSLDQLARVRLGASKQHQAEEAARESVIMHERLSPGGSLRRAQALATLALVLHTQGAKDEAAGAIALAEDMTRKLDKGTASGEYGSAWIREVRARLGRP